MVVNYFIISLLIAYYLKIDRKRWFCFILTLLLSIQLLIFKNLSIFIIAITIFLVLYLFFKIMNNTLLITSFLGASLPYISQSLVSLLISLIFGISIKNIPNLWWTDVLSKFVMLIVGFGLIYIKDQLTIFEEVDDWWVVSFIFIDLISILYILMDIIVSQYFDIQIMYLLIVLVLILVALFISLLVLMIKRNKEMLILEKNRLQIENIQTIKSMYEHVLETKHYIYYILRQIQHYIKLNDHMSLDKIMAESINKTQQLRHIIYTGNPYFDYSFNEMVQSKSIMNHHLKIMILIKEEPRLNKKELIDVLLMLFTELYDISNKEEIFEFIMSMKHDNLFIQITGSLSDKYALSDQLTKSLEKQQVSSHVSLVENRFTFKAMMIL